MVNLLHEKTRRLHPYFFVLLAFLAGCLCAGLFFNRQRFVGSGELDSRYDNQHGRATEAVRRLEDELERERDINRQLREHNTRARNITEGLAGAAERNVRNLQDAVVLIREIREKLKVLEDFYNNSDTGYGNR